MISVQYYYSACVAIETSDVRLLCDPWFTDGIYDGSWFVFPRFENPIEVIGPCDFIYVSHIHPDHYDPVFLKAYLSKFPKAQILIGGFNPNYLQRKIASDGLECRVFDEEVVGQTTLKVFLHDPGNSSEIDSALAVRYAGHHVVNLNDNLFSSDLATRIIEFTGRPEILLLGYTGAGEYPHTYSNDREYLEARALEKKERFFQQYRRYDKFFGARVNIPFAGKYVLGGHLQNLNDYRGVADATEVLAFDPKAVVLSDFGAGRIDTKDLRPTAERTTPYDRAERDAFLATTTHHLMDYEIQFGGLPQIAARTALRRLLPKAYKNAVRRSLCTSDYWFYISLGKDLWFEMNANHAQPECSFSDHAPDKSPRSEVLLDLRYLFGLITTVFHWNNAQAGSQLVTRRYPDVYVRQADAFLSFFHV